MSPTGDRFYEELPGFSEFGEFPHSHWYRPLPRDWLVVITDVRGSTAAIQEGRYKQVNAIGVASIVALLNALKPLQIPYVFGGDGATACIPASAREPAAAALAAARRMAADDFGLQLRVGIVANAVIEDAGHRVLIGKHQPSPWYRQAMFLGDGLGHAERLIKDPAPDNPYLIPVHETATTASFEGFECRWDEIPSPHEETISLLIQVLTPSATERERLYAELLGQIDTIYGSEEEYHPLRQEHLQLARSLQTLSTETRIRTAFRGRWARFVYLLRLRLLVSVGRWLMSHRVRTDQTDWGGYKQTLIANSDYRKFDELLRMVISGTAAQRARLRATLEGYRASGRIVFGIHASPTALITCVVSNYDKDHIHFLDGSNGGYALAAKEMKGQARALNAAYSQ